jgi:hypothetical protein
LTLTPEENTTVSFEVLFEDVGSESGARVETLAPDSDPFYFESLLQGLGKK